MDLMKNESSINKIFYRKTEYYFKILYFMITVKCIITENITNTVTKPEPLIVTYLYR